MLLRQAKVIQSTFFNEHLFLNDVSLGLHWNVNMNINITSMVFYIDVNGRPFTLKLIMFYQASRQA